MKLDIGNKIWLVLFVTVWTPLSVSAQTVEWESEFENHLTIGKSVAVDSNGDIVSASNGFNQSAYASYMYVRKLTPDGDLMWKDSLATMEPNNYHSVTWVGTDPENNIWVVGYRFIFSLTNEVPNAIKVWKFSPDGTLLENLTIDGTFGSGANTNQGTRNAAVFDESGNLFIGTVGTTEEGMVAGYLLLKISPSGALVWTRKKVFTQVHALRGIHYNNDRIVLTGKTTISDFNTELVTWNTDGVELWSSSNGDSNFTWGTDVLMDEAGNTYSLTQAYLSPSYQIALTKYDVSGTILYSQYYSLDVNATSGRMDFLPNGNIVLTGTNWSSMGSGTLYVAEVNPIDGQVVSDSTFSLANVNSWVYDIVVAPSGNYYVVGQSDNNGGAPAEMFLYAFSGETGFLWNISYNNLGVKPMDMAIDSNEQLYVQLENTNTTLKIGNADVVTAVSSNGSDVLVYIFPNPATDFLRIESPQAIAQVSIHDLVGRSYSPDWTGNNVISTMALPEGAYVLRYVLKDGKRGTLKFLKK